jgi:hypothetical protein
MPPIPTNVIAAWQKRADRLAQWAALRLVNRNDCWIRFLPAAKRTAAPDGRMALARQAPLAAKRGRLTLSEKSLARHFRGKGPGDLVGVHSVSEANTAKWIAIDMETHNGPADSQANLKAIHHWQEVLRAAGFYPLLIDCDGEGGYQLLVLFRQAVPASAAHEFARMLVDDYAAHGLDGPPRILPAGSEFDENDWLRIPGRHPISEHWSRAWKMRRWVEGADAAEALLHAHGDALALMQKFEAAFADRGGVLADEAPAPPPPPPVLSPQPAATIALPADGAPQPSKKEKHRKIRDRQDLESQILCYLLSAVRGERETGALSVMTESIADESAFSVPIHRTIYHAIGELHEHQERITPSCIGEAVSPESRSAVLELLDRLLLQKPPSTESFEELLAELSRTAQAMPEPPPNGEPDSLPALTTQIASPSLPPIGDDPELMALIESWPRLSSTVRQELITLAKQADASVPL